jgi:hypothetical protein
MGYIQSSLGTQGTEPYALPAPLPRVTYAEINEKQFDYLRIVPHYNTKAEREETHKIIDVPIIPQLERHAHEGRHQTHDQQPACLISRQRLGILILNPSSRIKMNQQKNPLSVLCALAVQPERKVVW